MQEILVLYYSHRGSVRALAEQIAAGIHQVPGAVARVRTVPRVSTVCEAVEDEIPADGPPYVELQDLEQCIGLALGSPTRFGNMAAPMKYFLDGLAGAWVNGVLEGKPASLFTSSASQHGGQETTITSFHTTLLHHGMVIVGLPYTFEGNAEMGEISGGTPYGASTLAGNDGSRMPSANELAGARFQGAHVATIAGKLAA